MEITLKVKIEAILFVESALVDISDMAEKLGIECQDCQRALEELKTSYREKQAIFDIILIDGKAQLVTRKELTAFIKDYFKKNNSNNNNFSPAMLEVLSIIAYKNPIKKAEIEKIRGVNCSLVLRKLLIMGLINQIKNKSSLESFLYSPSLKLFRKLGISRLEDLPDYDKLSKNLI